MYNTGNKFIKKIKDFYNENYKTLVRETVEDTHR